MTLDVLVSSTSSFHLLLLDGNSPQQLPYPYWMGVYWELHQHSGGTTIQTEKKIKLEKR